MESKDIKKFSPLVNVLAIHLSKNKEEIITNSAIESGIDKKFLEIEFDDSLIAIKGLVSQVSNVLTDQKVVIKGYKKKSFITFMPKGKVLQILPSTTPLLSSILLPLSAYIVGNKVIAKASSKASYIAKFLNVFYSTEAVDIEFKLGSGEKFMQDLLASNNNFVFFMGDQTHGRTIASYCTQNNIEYLGEYGGNDWAIVMSGNIKEITKKIANNILFKGGRDCDSIKGVLVHSKLYDSFVREMSNLLPFKPQINPVDININSPQFCSSLWIKKIKSTDDVLNLFKKNSSGLSACIFNVKEAAALKLARAVPSARVVINSDTLDINPLIPWGGINETSHGGVSYWSEKFVNKKLIELS